MIVIELAFMDQVLGVVAGVLLGPGCSWDCVVGDGEKTFCLRSQPAYFPNSFGLSVLINRRPCGSQQPAITAFVDCIAVDCGCRGWGAGYSQVWSGFHWGSRSMARRWYNSVGVGLPLQLL